MGFMGIAPNVEMTVHLDQPMKLALLVIGGFSDVDGETLLTISLRQPDGKNAISTPPISAKLQKGKTVTLGFSFAGATFSSEGKYDNVIHSEGKEIYSSHFFIKSAK